MLVGVALIVLKILCGIYLPIADCIIEKYVTNANRTDIFLIPKSGPRARRGIRDSHRMSFYDARFHHTFQCLSLNVKDQN